METGTRQRTLWMVVLGLWVPLGTQAWAGQPLGRMAGQLLHAAGHTGTPSTTMRVPAGRLDLRPPAMAMQSGPEHEFPAPMHPQPGNSANAARLALPALGASEGTPRLMSKPEQLAR